MNRDFCSSGLLIPRIKYSASKKSTSKAFRLSVEPAESQSESHTWEVPIRFQPSALMISPMVSHHRYQNYPMGEHPWNRQEARLELCSQAEYEFYLKQK